MGIVIEIACKDDGTFVVSAEPESEESQEEAGAQSAAGAPQPAASPAPTMGGEGGAEDEGGQVCHSFKEALIAASKIYKAQGQAQASDTGAQFSAGYGQDQAAPGPMAG